MAKKPIKAQVKLQIPAATATPAPPVGPALGQHGVNIGEFVKQFNEATKDSVGEIIPVEITIYEDRSFEFKLKTPPASDMLRRAAGIDKGSGEVPKKKAGKITKAQLRQIAERKAADLNADSIEQAEKIIAGTARSMGIDIV